MNIGGIPSKVLGAVQKNAMPLTVGGGMLARMMEQSGGDVFQAVQDLVRYATSTGTDGLLEELKKDTDLTYLLHKLFGTNHLYATLLKVGIAAWIAGELGVIPAKYKKLGQDVATGSAIAGVLSWGSGGFNNGTQKFLSQAPTYNY